MNQPNIDEEPYKRELVLSHVLPAFEGLVSNETKKIADIVMRCRIIRAIKYQQLEVPGKFSDGYLWFSVNAMCHSYFYDRQTSSKRGTGIYRKCNFIFNGDSLIGQLARTDYIQILENSEVLCISYSDLIELMVQHKDIDHAIRLLSARLGFNYRQHAALMNLPSLERVRRFRTEHQSFINCSTQEVQAMHVRLSLRAYIDKINQLRIQQ